MMAGAIEDYARVMAACSIIARRISAWMIRFVGLGVLAAPVSMAHAYDVDNAKKVAANYACMGCHAVNRKLVGPDFTRISAHYKGVPDARNKLIKKVKNGGAGVWGPIPMPAHPRLTDKDAEAVVDWVLDGAPQK